jgi:hypothetical protein
MRGVPGLISAESRLSSLVETVRNKTSQLIMAKCRYNSDISESDEDLSRKYTAIQEETVHIPLNLARSCVEALRGDRSRIPELLEDLRDLLEFQTASDSASLSGDEPSPDLDGLPLDLAAFLSQYDDVPL